MAWRGDSIKTLRAALKQRELGRNDQVRQEVRVATEPVRLDRVTGEARVAYAHDWRVERQPLHLGLRTRDQGLFIRLRDSGRREDGRQACPLVEW